VCDSIILKLQSNHLCLYSALYNTYCCKAALQR